MTATIVTSQPRGKKKTKYMIDIKKAGGSIHSEAEAGQAGKRKEEVKRGAGLALACCLLHNPPATLVRDWTEDTDAALEQSGR